MCEPQYSLFSFQPSLGANYKAAISCLSWGRGVTGKGSRRADRLKQEILQSDCRNDFLRVSRPGVSGN